MCFVYIPWPRTIKQLHLAHLRVSMNFHFQSSRFWEWAHFNLINFLIFRHCKWGQPMASAFWPGPWWGATDRWKLWCLWNHQQVCCCCGPFHLQVPLKSRVCCWTWVEPDHLELCTRQRRSPQKCSTLKHPTWSTATAGLLSSLLKSWGNVFFWFYALVSARRYSPAPISIKHLLEHGKTNDNLVGTIIWQSGGYNYCQLCIKVMIDEMGNILGYADETIKMLIYVWY